MMKYEYCPFISEANGKRKCTTSCALSVRYGADPKCVFKFIAFMLLDLLKEIQRKEKE